MRVAFLTLYPERAASPRYRVLQFVPYLREHGIECTILPAVSSEQYDTLTGPGRQGRAMWYHLAETPRRIKQLLSLRRYDVVFVQKAIMTAYVRGMLGLLRTRARRIVYDFDDAVHLSPPHPLGNPWRLFEDREQIRRLFNGVDLVLAGNAWLASVARESGARTELFPTVVDTERFVPAGHMPERYRIGWIGGPSTTGCLVPVAEAVLGTRETQICLVGADAKYVPIPNVEMRSWSYETEVSDIQSFSIGIMPLPKSEWTRGKCALKALQYMACGVPCVATPYGAALDIIRHGENGMLADSYSEWRNAFESLRDPTLRRRLGEAGRETVESRYSLKHAAPRLLALLESLI